MFLLLADVVVVVFVVRSSAFAQFAQFSCLLARYNVVNYAENIQRRTRIQNAVNLSD